MRELFLLLCIIPLSVGDKPADLVTSLPFTTFAVSFRQYSGYLQGSTKLHYWYTESQNNATTDPLVFFIAGGPGCSSVYALFEEIGPFKPYQAGDSLYENVFSWNKMANILVIDLPGVGYSPAFNATGESDVVSNLQTALWNFFINFKERQPNPLFIAGQGFASVYATKLANALLQQSTGPGVKYNYQGLIIANGQLNQNLQYDSYFSYAYVHGWAGKDAWYNLQSLCCKNTSSYSCSYSSSKDAACIQAAQSAYSSWTPTVNAGDIYQDCFFIPTTQPASAASCTAGPAIQTYLNRKEVRDALHVTSTDPFVTCSNAYQTTTQDLTSDLISMMNNANYTAVNATILIYNGDVDSTFNFIGARKVANLIALSRNMTMTMDEPWRANYHRFVYNDTDGGLRTEFTGRLYLITIRGGGYKAAINRPSQVLQIVRDFVMGFGFNNCLASVNLAAQPLAPGYQSLASPPSRKQSDLVTYLPGITFQTNGFKQYSGYLDGGNGSRLHYWFVESSKLKVDSPVILWLGGGPGGSALRGLLNENGPFKPNQNGQSLFENYYSWNKFAHLLYIESPAGVGYSYAGAGTLNDDTALSMNYNALKDFLSSFPEYNGEFFITGESYASVFVTMLSKKVLDGIQAKDITINLKGISIGNGVFSAAQQANSVIFHKYTYGLIGQTDYDAFTQQCCNNTDPTTCDFFNLYLAVDNYGNYKIKDGVDPYCANMTMTYVDISFFSSMKSDKNLYQDCYTSTRSSPKILPQNINFADYATMINIDSTDPFNLFSCWKDDATTQYLGLGSVRRALNIPDDAPTWQSYNPDFGTTYIQQNPDLTNVVVSILQHPIYQQKAVRTLIYNGDVDLVCSHVGNQWFVEAVAQKLNISATSSYSQWNFQMPGHSDYAKSTVGYAKVFSDHLTYATLKGAGHNAILDRPIPAFQMMFNFIKNKQTGARMSEVDFDTTPSPAATEYKSMPPCQQMPAAVPSGYPSVNQAEIELDNQNYTDLALADEILNLPGLPYKPNFRQFSGYLTPGAYPKNHLFYWFTESQNDPVNDPVLLWFNGGPGCSGLGGFFEELGPFHNNNDEGQTLYENVFAWNKKANVIFLEAPVGVGFSYTTDKSYTWNDDTSALNNALALKYFFEVKFPQYASHEFYISSESYGGVYVPTLSWNLINMIQNGTLNINFKGFAIGNGYLSHKDQFNSEITFQYGHGFTGRSDWNTLKSNCNLTSTNPIYYDYQSSTNVLCNAKARAITGTYFDATNTDPYDIYVDCYSFKSAAPLAQQSKSSMTRGELARRARMGRKLRAASDKPYVNNNDGSWYGSTDPFLGLACYNDDQLGKYLNRKDVQDAIHAVAHKTWTDCANLLYVEQPKYYDMSTVLNEIMDSLYYTSNNMRIMLYNGDADTICQFLGDQWWAERLIASRNMTTLYERQPWYYQKTTSDQKVLAGFAKRFSQNFVQMTVKGAGHMVPMDRPGPALQMILNFLTNSDSYSTFQPADISRQPLYPDYQNNANQSCTRRDSDRVLSLPGVDLSQMQDKLQYSGFLKGSHTHLLHYWLYDSANGSSNAPLLLWLNGGPGTSSLDGLFMENGLYRVNRDGKTLSLNPYAYDFGAMLYLESPVGVGYSYTTDGQTPSWNDDNSAAESYAALKDFFSVYPEYVSRPLLITGESYGGVYIPMLSKLIIDGMSTFPINFKGIAIGNGVLDKAVDTNSLPHAEFYRGGITYSRYQYINSLCCSDVTDEMTCDYSKHISDFNNVYYQGNKSDPCYVELMNLATDVLANSFDPYNLYEQCYMLLDSGVSVGIPVGETWTGINYESSDAHNAYWCWYKNALTNYLNFDYVRRTLNIPDGVQYWLEDANIMSVYQQQVNSTNDLLTYILNSDYVTKGDFHTLIYHGDVDTMKNWLGGEWFTYHLFNDIIQLKQKSSRNTWNYQSNGMSLVGGYMRQYERNVDVLTVRGAGHEVPFDRPEQSYAMMYNWLVRAGVLGTATNATSSTVSATTTVAPSSTQITNPATTTAAPNVATSTSATSAPPIVFTSPATTMSPASTATIAPVPSSTQAATVITTTQSAQFVSVLIALFCVIVRMT